MDDRNIERALRILERLVDVDNVSVISRIEDLETWQEQVESVWPQIVEDKDNGTN